MDKTCKYYQYQRYVSYDNGQTWQPMNQFQRGELMEFNSPDCGAGVDALYKWVLLDANTDYYCDECPEGTCLEPTDEYIESWGLMNPYEDYWCSGTTKMYKQIKQISYDSGNTWIPTYPPETAITNFAAEEYSEDCGYIATYRWHPVPITEEYVCSGGSMYYKEYYQVSYDYGETWENVTPTSSRTGSIYSTCSPICECDNGKLLTLRYSDSRVRSVECNSPYIITSAMTKSSSSYDYKTIVEANIGSCARGINKYAFERCTNLLSVTIPNTVTNIYSFAFNNCTNLTRLNSMSDGLFNFPSSVTTIENCVFQGCSSLTTINIPNSITEIKSSAFNNCTGLTNINIPSGVTSIGQDAFYNCRSLSNITVNAVTPPSLGRNALSYTNDCPIYVPAESVEAYKAASGWSTYTSRIQAINNVK